ncbi:MAG: DUF4838 domain-containing protein, partial [Planctomycetes bacterium]|nr:DUF4838 domain-containing protein [Planctomycetota bacterium]
SVEGMIRKEGTDPASFALVVKKDSVDIQGLSPESTLFATYEFLEQLGVRWYMPGEFGRVVPKTQKVILQRQSTVQVPSFPARWAAGYAGRFKTWQRRMRMGGPFFPPAHGVHLPKGYGFKEHPEYYALIDGKRRKRQFCVSNEDVVKGAIKTTRAFFRKHPDRRWIGMGPNDGRGFCQCEKCRALDGGDWDPFANHMSMTDRYMWFFNRILEGIKDEFPNKKICFYSYASYNRPPVKVEPNPRIVPAFAPITLCRIHGLGNPVCPEKNEYYRWLIQEWGKILPDVYDRGYWFNLADPGTLFPMVHRIRDQVPLAHKLGITGWRVECLTHWGSEAPSLYIAGKLMWNHKADVDALLKDFYTRFFGPAAPQMAEYFTTINEVVRDADYHTGSSYDIPHLYPPELRKRLIGIFDAASEAAPEAPYSSRVEAFRRVFLYTEAFCRMLEKRAVHDWAGAQKALKDIDSLREKLVSYDPQLVNGRYAVSYLRRFFRPCTEQGYGRTTGGNRMVVGLDDEWSFKLDPQGVGESLKFYSAELTGGNWRTLRTSTLSWSDQGLRYYKGDGWYRQVVTIPAEYEGKKIMLWFGGVDEQAKVWVNGKLIGESPGRALKPFEMDATESVLFGAENVVAVRVRNERLNELGTGGITAPVLFYASGEGGPAEKGDDRDVTPAEFR